MASEGHESASAPGSGPSPAPPASSAAAAPPAFKRVVGGRSPGIYGQIKGFPGLLRAIGLAELRTLTGAFEAY